MISIFLSLLFDDEKGLGYDPNVRRCCGDIIHYEYEVPAEDGSRYYRTCRALSSYRSLGISGRMTRVWEAVQISGFGGSVLLPSTPVALKDVWLDEGAMTERQIQTKIFDAVEDECTKHKGGRKSRLDLIAPLRKTMGGTPLEIIVGGKYRDYFMNISCDGKGQRLKNKPNSATPVRGLFSSENPKDVSSRSRRIPNADQSRNMGTPVHPFQRSPHTDVAHHQIHQNRSYRAKERYFLVYEDVCTALHDAPNLPTSFKALLDAWMGT